VRHLVNHHRRSHHILIPHVGYLVSTLS
jgi:hypothetical protein